MGSQPCLLRQKLLHYLVGVLFLLIPTVLSSLALVCLRSGYDGVVSVFRDRILRLHTTRSWDFLEAESGIGSERLHDRASNDVIIGIIDTGWYSILSYSNTGHDLDSPCCKIIYMVHKMLF